MKTNKHISIRMSEGMILYEMILVVFFTIILLLVSSCDSLTNPNTDKEQNYNPGQYQIYDKELTVSELKTAIQNYQGGSNIVYKVKGPMSNDDYNSVMDLIYIKRTNDWDFYNYVGLDLSSVTGLTKISTSYYLFSLTIPSSVYEIEGLYNSQGIYNIKITSDNPNFIYENGILYSADKTILYSYPKDKTDVSFVIPSTVKKICAEAFKGNDSIQNITIPESVIFIGGSVLDNLSIKTITFADKTNWFLSKNNKLIPINPDDLENAQSNGIFTNFILKPDIKAVTVSQLKTEINSYKAGTYTIYKVTGYMSNDDYSQIYQQISDTRNRFWNTSNYVGLDLSGVTGLTHIEGTWFLSSLTIPSSVSEFNDSISFYDIIIPSDNPNFIYEDGILYSTDKTILYLYPAEKTSESFEVPEGVKKIWAEAFWMNYNVKRITIPESVEYIGNCALYNKNIETLIFKNKENWFGKYYNGNTIIVNSVELDNIDNYNNANQSNWIRVLFKPIRKTVTLSQLITEINSYESGIYTIYKVIGTMSNEEYSTLAELIINKYNNSWYYNIYVGLDLSEVTGLTKISSSRYLFCLTIPSSVSQLSSSDRYDNIIISSDNPNFKYVDGVLYSADEKILYLYPKDKTDSSFVIPSTVTMIWCEAFWNNDSIQNITVPESVVHIGSGAFDNGNIQTLTFKDKQNWMARGNNSSVSPANPDDLENPANYRWNNQTQTNGICRNGIYKIQTEP